MATTNFQELSKSVNLIIANLRTFRREDSSLPENQIKLRACISLIHSEIETYFETIGGLALNEFENKRLSRSQNSKLNYSWVVYNQKAYEGAQENNSERIKVSVSTYKARINQNNGIKEKDILNILLPIGYPINLLDTTWLATLNSFGSLRGESAHKGISQIRNLIGYDYFDNTIDKIILPGIKVIDEHFAKYYNLS